MTVTAKRMVVAGFVVAALASLAWGLHAAIWADQNFAGLAITLMGHEANASFDRAEILVRVGSGGTRFVCVARPVPEQGAYVVSFSRTLFGTAVNEIETPAFHADPRDGAWRDFCGEGFPRVLGH